MLAADALLEGALQVTLVGGPEARKPLWRALNAVFAPAVAVVAWNPEAQKPDILAATLEGKSLGDKPAAAYVCRRFVCQAPVFGADALLGTL